MQELDKIVDNYLKTDTNYALMITGDWGSGKTYYFKNTLEQLISKTPVFQDNSKSYKPVKVSLFGLKSIEDIQMRILMELYPILKNSKLKLGMNLGKAVLKGYLKLKGLGELSEIDFSNIVDKEDLLNLEELLICFDDLERISSNIKIDELIGYVNSLIENSNIKLIILANNEELKDPKFSLIKEKVIGNIIEFIPDLSVTYDSIVKAKYESFSSYQEFLKSEKELILDVFGQNTQNLRTLIFTLTYFQRIYSEVNNNFVDEDYFKQIQNEILKSLLKFTLTISIEYRVGNISFKERKTLDESSIIDFSRMMFDNSQGNIDQAANVEEKKQEFSRKLFLDKYYVYGEYKFYGSVYDYITGGTPFEYTKLLSELKEHYHVENKVVLPQYEIMNKLNWINCFTLTDVVFANYTRDMLKYAYNGEYFLDAYLTVFYYSLRFENPLKLNIEKLKNKLISGMHKGKKNYKYVNNLSLFLQIDDNSALKEHLLELRKIAYDINNKIGDDENNKFYSSLEDLLYHNFEEFQNKVMDWQGSFRFEPVLSNFKTLKLYSFFKNSEPTLRWKIVEFFVQRYESPSTRLKPEIPFLDKLIIKLQKRGKRYRKRSMSGYMFAEFEKQLTICKSNLLNSN